MATFVVSPGQIWQDDCYYLDRESGKCRRKYVLILATDASGDPITAVFTSKPNGLTERPACSIGMPRAGYFVGTPGHPLVVPTWVDFSSIEILDLQELKAHATSRRTQLTQLTLTTEVFCAVLRCALQSDDITTRQARLLANVVAAINCP